MAAILFEVSDLTFDQYFKVKWSLHAFKNALFLASYCQLKLAETAIICP